MWQVCICTPPLGAGFVGQGSSNGDKHSITHINHGNGNGNGNGRITTTNHNNNTHNNTRNNNHNDDNNTHDTNRYLPCGPRGLVIV